MEISEIIKQAWDAVVKSGVPAEIQGPAFEAAIRLLSPASDSVGEVTKTVDKNRETFPASPASDLSEDQFYSAIVGRTNADKSDLERLILLEDGEPKIIANAIKGNLTTADSIRAIAQVLTIVRTLGLGQPTTPLNVIRTECERLNRNDKKNFKMHIKKIQNFTTTTKDKIEQLAPRPAAFDVFPSVVDMLLGNKPKT